MSQQGCVHAPVVMLAFDIGLGHQQQQVFLGCLVYDGIKGLLQNLSHHWRSVLAANACQAVLAYTMSTVGKHELPGFCTKMSSILERVSVCLTPSEAWRLWPCYR